MVTAPDAQPGDGDFHVQLDVFTGPFDLLLHLIAKHRLDVTEVALAQVTDDFLRYLHQHTGGFDLGKATEFLVVAATLLDLKAARLLPGPPADDEEDLALLEARDLLFARLLQYRAYQQAALLLAELAERAGRRYPRAVPLEPRYAGLRRDVRLGVGPAGLAAVASRALTPKPVPTVPTAHVHAPSVDVAAHAALLRERLGTGGQRSFRALVADCTATMEVVARFLALLDLYRDGLVNFDQLDPLGELQVRWTPAAA